ncbi:MAG: hypothetical protein Q4C12_03300 [Clostridia bacterium]|nr:hypothetical protein [Clostridia bacterium]
MKKAISVILVISIFVLGFSACGQKTVNLDAVNDALENTATVYGGVYEVVSANGSVENIDDLDVIYQQYKDIQAEVEEGNITQERADEIVTELTEISNGMNSINEAVIDKMNTLAPEFVSEATEAVVATEAE